MSETKHTPGPWECAQFVAPNTGEPLGLEGAKKYVAECIDKGGPQFFGVVCEKPDGPADVCHTGNGPTSAANARLIAAAPDLLAAAVAAQAFIRNGVEFGYIRMPEAGDSALETPGLLAAAIAKATA